MNQPGYDALWLWFGLSRASFCVLPRVLMHEMPDEWQGKMAELLNEYDKTFPNQPDITPFVCVKHGTRFVKMPDWAKEYRHPDYVAIEALRSNQA